MVYAEHLLSFCKLGIWVHAGQRTSTWPAPNKKPGHWVPKELSWWTTFPTCHNPFLEKLSMSYVTPLGENFCKFVPGFPWTLPHEPFPFLDFALDPFTIINHSHEALSTIKCWVLWVLLAYHQTWEFLETPNTFYKMVKGKMVFYSFS